MARPALPGWGGVGHYVKMVHNGIEYADMQLITETYNLLHRGAGFQTRNWRKFLPNGMNMNCNHTWLKLRQISCGVR